MSLRPVLHIADSSGSAVRCQQRDVALESDAPRSDMPVELGGRRGSLERKWVRRHPSPACSCEAGLLEQAVERGGSVATTNPRGCVLWNGLIVEKYKIRGFGGKITVQLMQDGTICWEFWKEGEDAQLYLRGAQHTVKGEHPEKADVCMRLLIFHILSCMTFLSFVNWVLSMMMHIGALCFPKEFKIKFQRGAYLHWHFKTAKGRVFLFPMIFESGNLM